MPDSAGDDKNGSTDSWGAPPSAKGRALEFKAGRRRQILFAAGGSAVAAALAAGVLAVSLGGPPASAAAAAPVVPLVAPSPAVPSPPPGEARIRTVHPKPTREPKPTQEPTDSPEEPAAVEPTAVPQYSPPPVDTSAADAAACASLEAQIAAKILEAEQLKAELVAEAAAIQAHFAESGMLGSSAYLMAMEANKERYKKVVKYIAYWKNYNIRGC